MTTDSEGRTVEVRRVTLGKVRVARQNWTPWPKSFNDLNAAVDALLEEADQGLASLPTSDEEENHEAIVRAEMHRARGALRRSSDPTVPRRASFDDLRVGQWVALQDEHHARAGRITERYPHGDSYVVIPFLKSDGATGFHVSRRACERSEVTILRDAPAPPVKVRREDLKALQEAWDGTPLRQNNPPLEAAIHALIDNAEAHDD